MGSRRKTTRDQMVKFGEFGEVDGEESKEKSISNLSGIHAVISNQVDC